VRRRDVGQRAKDRLDAARLPVPLLQHLADLLALQVLLRAAKRARDDGKRFLLRVGGEVVLGDGGEIVTQNFDRYPIVRMRSVPQIEIHLIDSTESPTGVGEVSVPSVAPALANAIAALTGTRLRKLPFSKTIKIY